MRRNFILYQVKVEPVVVASPTGNGGLQLDWMQSLQVPVRVALRLGPGLQPATIIDPTALLAPERVSLDKFLQRLNEPPHFLRKQRLEAANNPALIWDTYEALSDPVSLTWFQQLREPKRYLQGLGSALQLAFAIDPAILGAAEAVSLDKYMIALNEPVRRRWRIGTSTQVSRENFRSELE